MQYLPNITRLLAMEPLKDPSSSLSLSSSTTVLVPSPTERYNFGSCPLSEWIFPSTISGLADLTSSSTILRGDDDIDDCHQNNQNNATAIHQWWSCGYRMGLKLPQGSSEYLQTRVLDDFWNYFASSSSSATNNETTAALTLSLWFQPDAASIEELEWKENHNSDPIIHPIVTWMDANQTNNPKSLGCPGYHLQISIYLGHLMIRYSDGDPARTCRILYLHQVNLSTMWNSNSTRRTAQQLVLSLAPGSTSVYFNGHAVHKELTNSWVSVPWVQWPSAQLQLFGSSLASQQGRFRGAIHQLDLYNSRLSDAQIWQLYQQRTDSFSGSNASWPDAGTNNYSNPYSSVLELTLPPPETVTVKQGDTNQSVPIALVGPGDSAQITSTLQVALEFVQLPARGILFQRGSNGTTEIIQQSGRLFVPANVSQGPPLMSVLYQLDDPDVFNTPKIDATGVPLNDTLVADEFFTYRWVALDNDGYIVAATAQEDSIVQTISVQHVNHRPSLLAPPQVERPSNPDKFDPTDLICRGIRLLDTQDMDLDLIRVDVTAKHGRLTLSPDYRHWADFASCRGRTASAWQCLGNGMADRYMTFLTVPSRVEWILRDLVYRGFVPGSVDEIEITIYDGANDQNCLSIEEHEENSRVVGSHAWTSRTRTHFEEGGCFQVNATIVVPFMEELQGSGGIHGRDDDESGIRGVPNSDFKKFDLADLLFWIFLSAFLCAIVCCCGRLVQKCLVFCRARGEKVAIVDNNNDISNLHHQDQRNSFSSRSDNLSNRVVVFVAGSDSDDDDTNDSSLTGCGDEERGQMSV